MLQLLVIITHNHFEILLVDNCHTIYRASGSGGVIDVLSRIIRLDYTYVLNTLHHATPIGLEIVLLGIAFCLAHHLARSKSQWSKVGQNVLRVPEHILSTGGVQRI